MPPDRLRCDILVVGGGVTGITAAISAASAGARVIVVDSGVNAGSNANAGSLHVQLQSRFLRMYPEQAHNVEASLPLYLQAARLWETLHRDHGGVELGRDGGLMLAENEEQLRFLEAKAERELRYGLRVEILDRDALDHIAAYLGPGIVGAELCADEGKVNPLVANKRFRQRATALGVAILEDRVSEIGMDEGRVFATGRDRYCADRLILAASWGAGPLCAAFGLRLPTAAEPLHMNVTEPVRYGLRHLVQHAERPITVKQFQSGQVVIGGGWPARLGRDGNAPAVLADSMLGNVALAGKLIPAIARLRILRTWAGVNTTTDGKSVVGALDPAGRCILAVPGDAGYTLGPLVGTAAAAIALGAAPPFDTAPYGPARFS